MKFFLAVVFTGLMLSACGGGGPTIDARVLQLSLTYSIEGPQAAVLSGENGAASSGAQVECRLSGGGKPQIGTAVASNTGAFEMDLNLDELPQQLPDSDAFDQLNETVECRSGDGSWAHPLRQPRLQIE